MTIVSTIISRNYTVHASDSFITKRKIIDGDDFYEPVKTKESKIIKVERFKGTLSYWGLAAYLIQDQEAYIYDWFKNKAKLAHQYNKPAEFAQKVADDLNNEFSNMKCDHPQDKGLGIHFTAYEYVNNYWIPEFFLISNWENVKYNSIRSSGWGISRETYYADPYRDPNERIDVPECELIKKNLPL